MAAALAGLGYDHASVDVDSDPALEERFGELVPVLMFERDGAEVEVCHYFLDAQRLRALCGPAAA